jgi:NAD+ kinase
MPTPEPIPKSNHDDFSSIALVGLHTDSRVAESMRALCEQLAARERHVIVDSAVDLPLQGPVQRLPEAEFATHADLLIAIGGDGTMLRAARLASAANRPLLGVNRGRLGFLADISPADLGQRIDDVLAGQYVREHRAMLSACIERDGVGMHTALALNDVVLQKWETGRMIDFETWIDGQYVNTHGGDGLIVATSTGSTAYALSCGGPILHPGLEASVVVPICPHTLSDRPLVVGSAARIEVRLVNRPNIKAQVTCDGFMLGDVELQDRLVVGPAANRVTLLHPPGHDFYRILRSKLHWGRGGQKEREL